MSTAQEEVWKHWDSETLLRQYSPSLHSKRLSPETVIDAHVNIVKQAYEKAVKDIPVKLNVIYGTSDRQVVDIFKLPTAPEDSPIVAFIHGGYWQELSKIQGGVIIESLVNANAAVVLVGYDLAPTANMDDMVNQIKNAAKFVVDLAKKSKSRGVYFAGHSAGGHLVAMIPTSDWFEHDIAAIELIKGYICISGIFDLVPLVKTNINDPIKMTEDIAIRNSPALTTGTIYKNMSTLCKFLIVVGENDSPEFQRQSREFQKILEYFGINSQYLLIPEVDHFDILENLMNPKFPVTQEIIKMIA